MKLRFINSALVALAALLIAFPVLAADKGGLSVELTGKKVIKEANGKEKFENASAAKPGDIIEYQAVYHNKGKKKVTDVHAIIPVPVGTDYIPGSARPAKISASLDGKDYAPAPLKRKVKLPSGKEELKEVPATEYRFIRWGLKTLAPGQSVPVSVRVRISTAPAQQSAPEKK